MKITSGSLLRGRRIEFFSHTSEEEWGYETPQRDSFAVIHPRDEKPGVRYPMYLVLHSAGHDLYSCINCMRTPGDHDIYHTPDDSFALVPDCFANKERDWWWGGVKVHGDYSERNGGTSPTPCEKRVMSTLLWAIRSYAVDERRVYAVGNSMGGSGALGIALRRGDVFAAIKVNVPAGVRHAIERCAMTGDKPDGFFMPDPPPVIDYSAQNDELSFGHDAFYAAMRRRKYAVMGFFGPFGHENNNARINAVNDLVHAFDVETIRLDESYPVFMNASTDDALPWENGKSTDSTASGQVNAFFRWRVIADEADRFEIALRLLRPDEWESRVTFPESSSTDVALRRLQKFRLAPAERFAWVYEGASGDGSTDGEGVPTVKQITVTRAERTLILRRVK